MTTTVLKNLSFFSNDEVVGMIEDQNLPQGTWSFNVSPLEHAYQGVIGHSDDRDVILEVKGE